jgi:Asp-tRNA(Asn)/Glu-tRNA(Gln) amidotransferase A subunit family amidase
MSANIADLGLFEMAEAVRQGQLRSVDLVEACLERIARREAQVHAWAWLDPAAALASARQRDQQPPAGPLHGVPIAVKDIMDTVDMPTGYGSPIYQRNRPSWDASCVAMARRAGAVILGKTVSTEFAYFAPGSTANPRNLLHTPGGSSSGSAAAVADGMVPAGFGTQTAASVTRPASYCGVVGYKASLGGFNLAGIKAFAPAFDSLGTLTRDVHDAQWLRWALLGKPGSPDGGMRSTTPRIGICRTPWWAGADPDCQRAIESAAQALAAAGALVADVELPVHFDQLATHHKTLMAYEAAHSLAFEYDSHKAALSPQLRQLIEDGMAVRREQYLATQQIAALAREQFAHWMNDWDALLAPSATGAAPLGLYATGDPLFSRMWTLLGLPSVTLPGASAANGLPIGVQLICRIGEDEQLLATARWAEPLIRNLAPMAVSKPSNIVGNSPA